MVLSVKRLPSSPTRRANFRLFISLLFNAIAAVFLLYDTKGSDGTQVQRGRESIVVPRDRDRVEVITKTITATAPAGAGVGAAGVTVVRTETVTVQAPIMEVPPRADGLGAVGAKAQGKGCGACEVAPELCAEIESKRVLRAMDGIGPNHRLRRALARIRAGEPFTVGALGGSGHGVHWGPEGEPDRFPANRPANMHRTIFDYLHSLAPKKREVVFGKSGKKEGKNGFVNGSKAATGSGYFAYCFPEHIPEDVDIVIIELAINDELQADDLSTYEMMIRGVLDLPNKPAIVYAHIFNLLFNTMAFGGDMHRGLNRFYGIPTVSLRDAYLEDTLADNFYVEKLFIRNWGDPGNYEGMDLRHISNFGHRIAAQLMNAYIGTELCEMENDLAGKGAVGKGVTAVEKMYPVSPVPRMRLMQKWDPELKLGPLKPSCSSVDSENHPLTPVKNEGWRKWNWKQKWYWIATEPGSTISFPFHSAMGEVHLHYLRSASFGLGNAECWVDDDTSNSMYLQGWWPEAYNIAQSSTISDVPPGDRILNCRLSKSTADPKGGHEFRIISLTSI